MTPGDAGSCIDSGFREALGIVGRRAEQVHAGRNHNCCRVVGDGGRVTVGGSIGVGANRTGATEPGARLPNGADLQFRARGGCARLSVVLFVPELPAGDIELHGWRRPGRLPAHAV